MCVLTVRGNFKARSPVVTGGQDGQPRLDELPVHKRSKERRASVRVDVGYGITSHLPVVVHLPEQTAAVLEESQTHVMKERKTRGSVKTVGGSGSEVRLLALSLNV